jgi:hypothetical protein
MPLALADLSSGNRRHATRRHDCRQAQRSLSPSHHGRAVVCHQRSGQGALLNGLTKAMYQALGRLIEISLGMADDTRAIIHDGQ